MVGNSCEHVIYSIDWCC